MLSNAFQTAVLHIQKLTGRVPDEQDLLNQIEIFEQRIDAWQRRENPNFPSNRHFVDVDDTALDGFIQSEQNEINKLKRELRFFYPEENAADKSRTNEIA